MNKSETNEHPESADLPQGEFAKPDDFQNSTGISLSKDKSMVDTSMDFQQDPISSARDTSQIVIKHSLSRNIAKLQNP